MRCRFAVVYKQCEARHNLEAAFGKKWAGVDP
jgi:hypothetical protein